MWRNRLAAVGLIVAARLATLTPRASALCLAESLEEVVDRVDAVVVATVADAAADPNKGITLNLEVEEVLKGSAGDAQQVAYSTCGPPIFGPGVTHEIARNLVGQRDIYFLTNGPKTTQMYGQVIEPQVSIAERIVMTRDLLGIEAPTDRPPVASGGSALGPIVGAAVVVILLSAGWFLLRKRDQTSRESSRT